MSDLTVTGSALPAHLKGAVSQEVFDELGGGVSSGFPIISYKGKVWRVRKGGELQTHADAEGDPIPNIEVVILRSLELPSKTFYRGKYSEGDNAKPDCWSSNGIKPDAGVPDPVHPNCAACPNNVWGSKVTDSGAQTKACADVRRVAVAMVGQVEEFAAGKRSMDDIDVLLLRVPAASLNPLKDYGEKVLKPKGIPFFTVVTKVGFDSDVAYPKFTFKALRFLNEDEFSATSTLRESDEAKRVLNESSEYDEAGTTGDNGKAAGASTPPPADAKSPAPAKSKAPKAQPVEETAVQVEADASSAEEVDDIEPAPAAKKPPKKAAAPVPSSPESGGDDFDALLDSILD